MKIKKNSHFNIPRSRRPLSRLQRIQKSSSWSKLIIKNLQTWLRSKHIEVDPVPKHWSRWISTYLSMKKWRNIPEIRALFKWKIKRRYTVAWRHNREFIINWKLNPNKEVINKFMSMRSHSKKNLAKWRLKEWLKLILNNISRWRNMLLIMHLPTPQMVLETVLNKTHTNGRKLHQLSTQAMTDPKWLSHWVWNKLEVTKEQI